MLGAHSSKRSHSFSAVITRSSALPLKSLTISEVLTCFQVCRSGKRKRVPPRSSFGRFLMSSLRYAGFIPSNVFQKLSSSCEYIVPGCLIVASGTYFMCGSRIQRVSPPVRKLGQSVRW